MRIFSDLNSKARHGKIAFLTSEPLEAPLKGFPPNQPNLISAIETWLGEI
ncbi:MAG: histidine kinase [Limnospira sp. PMC 1291.21]|uniref:Histidine kinase n=1 Tax=Limnospira fusiformis PMC 851.14 TaxID=2219512 RepID=A0ABU9EI43_LIMFS|nr:MULTISPECIES: hypothetical protein [Limnospira]EKD07532.1 putative signal transduction protein with Nacht domain [Arthrospira platensis C1]MDC0837798.1 histidine kinase [Limnoraphis robusta]MDY7051902.1 histidine kinase [Limnospira fusiformis LS22]QJB25840.1 histidine kinase [Limnospira fusiformis SAG 85.79]RAQ44876.1 histidine kinase [Arthrospira sp. O9.13F]